MPLPEGTAVCRTVEVVGCFTPTPAPMPTLVFQFTHEDGTAMPPIALVLDETDAAKLPGFIHQEAWRSIGAARTCRRLS